MIAEFRNVSDLGARDPGVFAPGFVAAPFWVEAAPALRCSGESMLPGKADLVIVGGGYTGLSAAAAAAEGGRSTLIVEAGPLGYGCSARNGGQVSASIKPTFARLSRRHGSNVARAIHEEGLEALEGLRRLITDRALDCDWQPVGRLLAAHTPRAFERLRRLAEAQNRTLNLEVSIIERRDLAGEVATQLYHGALLYPKYAAVNPWKLLLALYQHAIARGVQYIEHCAALHVEPDGEGFIIKTTRGLIRTRDVLVATNGYTGSLCPWLRRRVIPICSHMIATEPLDGSLVAGLLPKGRTVVDTRKLMVYFRPSPDGRRILFGGRASIFQAPEERAAPRLVSWLRRIFPELSAARVTHAWQGTVAYTFDELPHLGHRNGIYYCMGYCGSGISLSIHFGRKMGLKILGRKDGATALDEVVFQTRPLYHGRPWFLAPSILMYRILDSLG